jgi:hypothetical protein
LINFGLLHENLRLCWACSKKYIPLFLCVFPKIWIWRTVYLIAYILNSSQSSIKISLNLNLSDFYIDLTSININWPLYVAMSESGKSLGIDRWNINLYFKLFFSEFSFGK